MSRLAYSGQSSGSSDYFGRTSRDYMPRYETVTHQLSDLTVEVLKLLAEGTSTEALVQKFSACSAAELLTLQSDLELFSRHKIPTADRAARETVQSIQQLAGDVLESRTPQGKLTQKIVACLGKGTTLAELEALLQNESSETLCHLAGCLDRVSARAGENAKPVLETVKRLAAAVEDSRTSQGALALQILALLDQSAGQEQLKDLLEGAADDALRNLPASLDRLSFGAGATTQATLCGIKERAGRVLESRTLHGKLAHALLELNCREDSRPQVVKLLTDADDVVLKRMPDYLDRLAAELSLEERQALISIKGSAAEVLESRRPPRLLASQVLAALSGGGSRFEIVPLLSKATTEVLRALSAYLDQVSGNSDKEVRSEIVSIKTCVVDVLECRTPYGVLGQQVLEVIQECLANPQKVAPAEGKLVSLFQAASSEVLANLPPYLDRIVSAMPEEEQTKRAGAFLWVTQTSAADLKRRERGKPPSALCPRSFCIGKQPTIWTRLFHR